MYPHCKIGVQVCLSLDTIRYLLIYEVSLWYYLLANLLKKLEHSILDCHSGQMQINPSAHKTTAPDGRIQLVTNLQWPRGSNQSVKEAAWGCKMKMGRFNVKRVVGWWKRLAKGYCVVFLHLDVLFSPTLFTRHFFHPHLKLLPWFQISYSSP